MNVRVRVFTDTDNTKVLLYLELLHNYWGHLGVRLIDHTDAFYTWNIYVFAVYNDEEDDTASKFSATIMGDAAKDPPYLQVGR